jgi:hypothetical protein
MRYIFTFLVCVFLFTQVYAQEAGLNIYAGPSAMFSRDKIVTKKGEGHYGYVIGANARLNSDFMYFLFSGEYGTFDFLSSKSLKIVGGNDLTYMKGKIGLGFDVVKLGRRTHLRTKFQGNIMFVNNFDQSLLEKTASLKNNGYTNVNDGIGGLSTGIGISKGAMTLDLEYEYGLFNFFYEKEESKLDFLNLVMGVRF